MKDAEAEAEAIKNDPKLAAKKAQESTLIRKVSSKRTLRNPLSGATTEIKQYDRERLREQIASIREQNTLPLLSKQSTSPISYAQRRHSVAPPNRNTRSEIKNQSPELNMQEKSYNSLVKDYDDIQKQQQVYNAYVESGPTQ